MLTLPDTETEKTDTDKLEQNPMGICVGVLSICSISTFTHSFHFLFTGGGVCLSACWDAAPPRTRHPPRDQTPQDQAPPPGPGPPTRHRACWEIRSTCGRYASYWNAILFIYVLIGLGVGRCKRTIKLAR